MAVEQTATYQGIENDQTRPGSQSRTAALRNLVEDQAHLYEATTGVAVPDAAGIAATPHRHDGALGAVMRTPLLSVYLDATLDPVRDDRTGTSAGWSAIVRAPFFSPEGVDAVTVVFCVRSSGAAYFAESVRVRAQNVSFVDLEQPVEPERLPIGHYLHGGEPGSSYFSARIDVVEGGLSVLVVEAWEGRSVPSASDDDIGPRMVPGDRNLSSLLVLPVDRAPVRSVEWREPTIPTTRSAVGSSFVSMDAELLRDDLGVASFHLVRSAQNDGLLWEVVTGRPASNRAEASQTHAGHNHADDATNDLDDAGDEVDLALGAWFYGVGRRAIAGDFRPTTDQINEPDTAAPEFTGRFFLVAQDPSKATPVREVARHTFRLPRLKAASVLNSTGKVRARALVYSEVGARVSVTIQAHDTDESNSGTAQTQTMAAASSGYQLLTFSGLDLDVDSVGSGLVGDDSLLLTVDLLVDDGSGGAPGAGDYGGLCGLCVYFEGSP